MKVFLADLQNSYYRYIRNSVPIGMGFVASYLDKRFGQDVELHLFRKFEELHEALDTTTPDLVALGSYSWNTSLTARTGSYLRKRLPNTVIAIGGPDVSENTFLTYAEVSRQRQFDFFMPNEGEMPTASIVEAMLGADDPISVRSQMIKGCISVNPEDGKAWGTPISRFEGNINEIPSPYFGGLMDRFLDSSDYLPIIQTSRGCPYRCTFCVSGKETWSKLKTFDMDRVKAEIDYVEKKAASRYMRFADENFGILPRDVEIAEYLMETKQKTGFPHSVSIYTDKHPTERVRQISRLLSNMMPFNISFQSLTGEVLENIKRINLKDSQIQEAVKYARDNSLLMVTELIFPLPGETKESFLETIDRLFDYRFESAALNQLRILKGTEMDDPADREKFGVVSRYSMSENGYTHHPDLENIEIDEWVVANNAVSEDDYYKVNRFIVLLDFAFHRAYLKYLMFYFETLGIRSTSILMRAVEDAEACPVLFEKGLKFETGMRAFLHETPEEAEEYVRDKMAAKEEITGIYRLKDQIVLEIVMSEDFTEAVLEVANVGLSLYKEKFGEVPDSVLEELAFICDLTHNANIPMDRSVPHVVDMESQFDVLAWIANNFDKPLRDYRLNKPKHISMRIRSPEIVESVWSMQDDPLVKYKRGFAVINSANRLRAIEARTGQNPSAELHFSERRDRFHIAA